MTGVTQRSLALPLVWYLRVSWNGVLFTPHQLAPTVPPHPSMGLPRARHTASPRCQSAK